MTYYKNFLNNMALKGTTSRERRFNQKSRSFQQWFESALNKEIAEIDGVEQYIVMQDQNQNNNKDLSDDKYIITENSSNIKAGSYVTWRNQIWLVFTEELKTIATHKQAKVKESNGHIKWVKNGAVKSYPAYIQNQTLYTLGVATSGSHAWIVNAKMTLYTQMNDDTKSIKIGQRIFIGDNVYQIMFKDYVSRTGLVNYLLEEDFINPNRDNLELQIADYYDDGDSLVESTANNINTVNVPSTIEGVAKAKIGSTVKFEAKMYENGIIDSRGVQSWTIADTESVAKVINQTESYIEVKIESNFKKVGSVINIIAKGFNGEVVSKSVNIVSPY